MRLTTRQIKHLKSLRQKKFRKQTGSFLVQGDKICKELLLSEQLHIRSLIATDHWLETNFAASDSCRFAVFDTDLTTMAKISSLQSVPPVVMEIEIPKLQPVDRCKSQNTLFFLDCIQDPGNLGTIIRICDWFGLENLILSPDCVDPYNPKVVQASMASIARVSLHWSSLATLRSQLAGHKIVAATTTGKGIDRMSGQDAWIILIGNEGRGISEANKALVDGHISISNALSLGAESLNAAIAAGIIAYQRSFCRQLIEQ